MGKRHADDSGPIYDVPPAGYRGGGYMDSSPWILWGMVGAVMVLLLFLVIAALTGMSRWQTGPVDGIHRSAGWLHAGGLVQPSRRGDQERTVFVSDPSMEPTVQTVLRHLMKGEYRAIHSIGHPVMRARMNEDQFRTAMRSTMTVGLLEAAKLENIDSYMLAQDEGGRVAMLRYRAQFKGGPGTLVLMMAVDGDKWLPLSIEVTPIL